MAEKDIETEEIVETPEPEVEDEAEKQASSDTNEEDVDGEIVVSIGEDSPPQEDEDPESNPLRELRTAYREQKKRNRELQAKLEEREKAEKSTQLRPKPTLADHDYDEDAFGDDLAKWAGEAREIEAQQASEREQVEAQNRAYQEKFEGYKQASQSLKVSDFEDAEAVVQDIMSETQQGMLVHGSEKPELLIYALGRDEARAKKLSSIKDPVQFAFAAGKLEAELKVTNRKPRTQPEKRVSGNTGAGAGSVDKTLERLRAKAAETGDMTPVLDYKRKMQQAS